MMKIQILIGLLLGVTAPAYAQGYIHLANAANTSPNPAATANGLFWLSTGGTPALINQVFNAAFYGRTDSSSLSSIATFLLSNDTAAHDNAFGSGTFVDPAANAYTIPGAFTSAFIEI